MSFNDFLGAWIPGSPLKFRPVKYRVSQKNCNPLLCAFSHFFQLVMIIKTNGAQFCDDKETNEWSNSSEDLTRAEILHFWFREADLKHKTIHPKIMHISSAVFTDKLQKGENKGWYPVVNQQENINYKQLTEIVTYTIQ